MATKAILTTGLLLVLALPLGSAIQTPSLGVAPAAPDSCAVAASKGLLGGSAGHVEEVISESGWTPGTEVDASGLRVSEVVKVLRIAFATRDAPADVNLRDGQGGSAAPAIQNCTAGVCTVEVHVYANSTTTVQGGVGFLAFLPFFFAIGGSVTVEQHVSTDTETKIACQGSLFVGLTFTGGIGPQHVATSILKTNSEQAYQGCDYLNAVGVQDSCSTLYTGDFSLQATHAGNYTRFDIVNGGRFAQNTQMMAAGTEVAVRCTPAVGVYLDSAGIQRPLDGGHCIGPAGEWRVVFPGITNKSVDTAAAVQLLREARSAAVL